MEALAGFKAHTEYLSFETPQRRALLNITEKLERILAKSGVQAVLPVTKGRLDLGPWEQVFYAEFDGRRRKRVVVKVIGG